MQDFISLYNWVKSKRNEYKKTSEESQLSFHYCQFIERELIPELEKYLMKNFKSIREVNKHFRKIDESHLFPIRDKFNVTERAIRQARKFKIVDPYEYYLTLENIMSQIVNNPKNW